MVVGGGFDFEKRGVAVVVVVVVVVVVAVVVVVSGQLSAGAELNRWIS